MTSFLNEANQIVNQAPMPSAADYDAEIESWPWKLLLLRVSETIAAEAPPGSRVLDYMCGTGIMLRSLAEKRPDLILEGCDISSDYIVYANAILPNVKWHLGNVLEWKPDGLFDYVTCCSGLHHLPKGLDIQFLKKLQNALAPTGQLLIGEILIAADNTQEMRIDSLLSYYADVFQFIFAKNPKRSVIESSLQVFANDVMLRGEFKYTLKSLCILLENYFLIDSIDWVWPERPAQHGDAILRCQMSNGGNRPTKCL